MTDHLVEMIRDSIRKNWDELALTDFHGSSFQYRDLARKIAKLHLAFEYAGIKSGDKIALCGRNSAQWAVAFLATLTYGAVAVPLLHEFKSDNIHHLINHSDSKLLFVNNEIWENLDAESMPKLLGAVKMNDFSLLFSRNRKLEEARHHLNELFGKKYPERFTPDDVNYTPRDSESLALINYTSGSTGFSKGVMLSYKNLWSNVQFTIDGLTFLGSGDGMVCMLPLAHMYLSLVDL
ncbi:MAG: AMP-binding protein [Muribaculaceae bacterium]|nr:AMP-binding protein [Muribaculaceae bacterium]